MGQHLVQKYIFDVDFDSEDKAYTFQVKLADFIREKLVALTDEVFTETGRKKNVRINRLTLDLGTISFQNFEEEIYQKLKSELIHELSALLRGYFTPQNQEVAEVIPERQATQEILLYFLEHGYLPWSARRKDSAYTTSGILLKFIEDSPAKFKKHIGSLLVQEEIRLRFIRQFDDPVLLAALKLWAAGETEHYHKLYTEMLQLFRKKKILRNTVNEFRELLWKFLILEIIIEKKTHYNSPETAKRLLTFLAKEGGQTREALLLEFYAAMASDPASYGTWVRDLNKTGRSAADGTEDLPKVIVQLISADPGLKKQAEEMTGASRSGSSRENPSSGKASVSGDQGDVAESNGREDETSQRIEALRRERLERIRNYLQRFFSFAIYSGDRAIKPAEVQRLETLIRELLAVHPALFKRIISESAADIREIRVQKLLELFTTEVRNGMLKEGFGLDAEGYQSIQFTAARSVVEEFIRTGYLPYRKLPQNITRKELEQIFRQFFDKAGTTAFAEVKELVATYTLNSADSLFRIAQFHRYLPVKFIEKHFREYSILVTPPASEEEVSAFAFFSKTFRIAEVKDSEVLYYMLGYYIEKKAFPAHVQITLSEVVAKLMSEEPQKEEFAFFLLNQKTKAQELILKDLKQPVLAAVKALILQKKEAKQWLDTNIPSQDEVSPAEKETKVSREKKTAGEEQAYAFKKVQLGEPIYITNAGLVIFHPFLSRFFKMLNLLDKKDFKDELSAHKAAHLLQYLVNKTTHAEEHEMVLNKLLCGIDLSVPLHRDIEITEEEKATCESLIEGVIQNWSILKKASNDNFRGSFVMREGRLVLEPQGWKLKVEERGYDILVEKIPWSLSMIKLPWMDKMIYVEWK